MYKMDCFIGYFKDGFYYGVRRHHEVLECVHSNFTKLMLMTSCIKWLITFPKIFVIIQKHVVQLKEYGTKASLIHRTIYSDLDSHVYTGDEFGLRPSFHVDSDLD